PLAEALEITRQLASALDAAHAAGVVHRDVKPANVLWNALGALVLADFGIARDTLTAANHTQTGTVIGTPLYLSPEQAQAQKVTPASDIYSLGVVLFELLTGRVPFTGDTAMSIAIQHIQAPPPALTALRADLSPAVEAVVLRALAKDPAARYKQAGLLVQALEQALRKVTPSAVVRGVHGVPTTVWTPPAPAALPPASLLPVQPPAPASVAPPTQAPPPAPQPTSLPVNTSTAVNRHALMLALAALCIGVVLITGLVALRRSPSLSAAAGESPTQPAAVATAPATSFPTSAPTSAPSATAEPATPVPPSPTPVPPSPTPVPPSPTPENPLVSLRTLLVAGVADGSIRRGGDDLINQLDAFTQQLRNQNAQRARRELRNLQNELNQRKKNGDATPEFADAALQLVDAVAATYQINLQGGDDDDD
ncbi:MAG: serine/threonine protein kinase, partial [Chloroflexaceae bacterium]|nr:serine/threonine protein kinase [Chloroflexaceae bacterium]